jgi:hypothetical protein
MARGGGGVGGVLDLERHFAFYGAYHSNPVNVFIHALFVWPIFLTALLLLHLTAPSLHAAARAPSLPFSASSAGLPAPPSLTASASPSDARLQKLRPLLACSSY